MKKVVKLASYTVQTLKPSRSRLERLLLTHVWPRNQTYAVASGSQRDRLGLYAEIQIVSLAQCTVVIAIEKKKKRLR